METNSKKVLAALPSFEDYMALAEQIKALSLAKMRFDNKVKEAESYAFRQVMTDPKYFVNGKTVSVSYFENCYKQTGLNDEISELRDQLAQIISELDSKKVQFDIYKQMHDLYKALAYQEKGMS